MRRSGATVLGAVLLGLVLAGCQMTYGGGDGGGYSKNEGDTGDEGTAGGSVPQELVGVWGFGSISGFSYKDAVTGVYVPASGNTAKLVIEADGSFGEDSLLQTSVYSCTTTLFVMERGAIETSGDTLVMRSNQVKTTMRNTCSQSGNYDNREGENRVRTFRYTLKSDDRGPVLEFTADDGGVITYRPENS